MQIEVLGTIGEIESSLPNHKYHSGVLIDSKLLLDLGEASFLERHPSWILVTHLHPDHAAFLGTTLHQDLPVIIAPESSMVTHLQISTQPFTLGGYHITPVPTRHSQLVKSQGYRVDDGKHSIFYSGDLLDIEKDFRSLLVKLDLVITDGSFIHKGGLNSQHPDSGELYGHTGIPDLIDLFAPYTKKIMFTHFGEWFFKDPEASALKLKKLGEEKGIEVLVGYEGLHLTI